MGKIVVSEFITVDGVMQAPGDASEYEKGGWAMKADRGDDGTKFKLKELFESDALLLGQTTYDGFSKAWPAMPEDPDGYVNRMNTMDKYVVTDSPRETTWNNSHVVSGDIVKEIGKLKQQISKNILVFGSGLLTQTLIRHRLVDEIRLMVYPVVLGAGKKMFQDGTEAQLKLTKVHPLGNDGIVLLVYTLE